VPLQDKPTTTRAQASKAQGPQAAEKGRAHAQRSLGVCYAEGEGVPHDNKTQACAAVPASEFLPTDRALPTTRYAYLSTIKGQGLSQDKAAGTASSVGGGCRNATSGAESTHSERAGHMRGAA
jgi:hypothetical protein